MVYRLSWLAGAAGIGLALDDLLLEIRSLLGVRQPGTGYLGQSPGLELWNDHVDPGLVR